MIIVALKGRDGVCGRRWKMWGGGEVLKEKDKTRINEVIDYMSVPLVVVRHSASLTQNISVWHPGVSPELMIILKKKCSIQRSMSKIWIYGASWTVFRYVFL